MNGGWMNCCKKHLKTMESDIKKKGHEHIMSTPDADGRGRCDYPKCKERAVYEVYWNDHI